MTARRAKQVIYGALYGIAVIGILYMAISAFVPRAPSAPPAPLANCPGTGCGAAGVNVGGFTTFVSGPGYYTFLARLENKNPGFASPSFGYRLNVLGAGGGIARSLTGKSFIYGGEVKYIVIPNVNIGIPSSTVSFTIENPVWEPASSMGLSPQFNNPLQAKGSSVTNGTITVSSALTDSDALAFANIEIVAIFYGKDGIAVGASDTELNSISPGETEQFSVSYPYVPSIDPLQTKIFAYALRPQ